MLGLDPTQLGYLGHMAVEFASLAVGLWLYHNRYVLRGFYKRIRCHL